MPPARIPNNELSFDEVRSVLSNMQPVLPNLKRDGTDEAGRLQEWINYLQDGVDPVTGLSTRVGALPPGSHPFSTIDITRPLTILAPGSAITELRQIANTSTPAIRFRVAHTGTDYYASKNIPATIIMRGFRVRGENQLSGQAGQHGLDLQNASANPILTRVLLDDVIVTRMSGSGIAGTSFSGWVEGRNVFSQNNNLNGINGNTCNDWHFVNSSMHSNTLSNVLLSGCAEWGFMLCNMWSSLEHNLYLFGTGGNANHKFTGCQFDRAAQHNIHIDLRGGEQVSFGQCTVEYASQQTNNTYHEINFAASADCSVSMAGCMLGRTFSQQVIAIEKSQNHFNWAGAGGKLLIDGTTTYKAGAVVTSHPTRVGGFYTAGAATDSTGYVLMPDAAGNMRKFMIQA